MVERDPGLDPRDGRPGRRAILLRRTAASVVLLGILLVVGLASASILRDDDPPPPPTETAPPLARLRIIFPEGFTRREMADRVAAVREIAIHKRDVTPRLTRSGYLLASAAAKPPAAFLEDWAGKSIEGFLFPATYEFSQFTPSTGLVRDQLAHFRRQWRKVDLRYARSKNLTPYDVLIIASMIEKEAVAPEERRLVAAVVYNRLRQGMQLGIDATIRYGRNVPGTEPLKAVGHQERRPVQHEEPRRAAADADLESRARVDARGGRARERRLPLLRAQAGRRASLLHRERVGVLSKVARVRLRRLLTTRARWVSQRSPETE